MSLAKIGKRLLLRHTLVVISIMLSLFLVRTAQAAISVDTFETLGKWTVWGTPASLTLCDTQAQQGTYSLCMSFVNNPEEEADGRAMYYNFSANPIDTTGYDLLRFWFKATAASSYGRTMIYLSDINNKSIMTPLECLYSSIQPNEWYEITWPFKTLSGFRDNILGGPLTIDFTQITQILIIVTNIRYSGITDISLYFDDMKFMSSEEFLIDKDDNTGTDTGKKLIVFGDGGSPQGTPLTETLRTNIATMEAQFPAVNGLVLQPSTDGTGWDSFKDHFWSNETMLASVANPSLDDLANTSFSQYTDNFMRINCTPPGYADYFDDAAWTALTAKAAIAAKICHDGGLKGIFFDTEAYNYGYNGNPWNYNTQPDSPLYTYDEYVAKTRQRGGEFMDALISEYPDITILLPWAHYSGVVSGVVLNVIPPRLDTYNKLYGAFLDGMLDECGDATFVDACECGYGCKTYADFLVQKIIIKYIAPYSSAEPDIYRAKVKLGYGLWFTGNGSYNTEQEWIDYGSSANPYGAISPEQLSNMIYYARWIGDSGYTWFYRCPVWNNTVGAYIPQEYLDAIADPHPAYLYTALTSPENDDIFVPPSGITLEATASDTESAVSKVEFFYDGTNKIGEDTTSPYSCLWNSPVVGTHILTSVATDSRGFKRTSGAVSIRVDALPVANPDSYNTLEDTQLNVTTPGVLSNDTDADSQTLTATKVTDPAHGAVTVNGNGSFTYTPVTDYNGTDSFTYQATDPDGGSATATVTITVTAVNDVPSFTKGSNQTVDEDCGAQTVTGWATAISPGPGNESSQAVNFIVSNDNNPLFSAQPAVSSTGTLTYTPATNGNGTTTVSVQIHDNGGVANGGVDTSATQTFTITVNPVNDAPTVSITGPSQGYSTTAPATLSITATASDIDGTISKVEFYNNGILLGEDTTSPYSYSWANVEASGSGGIKLTAKAYDNNSAITTSSQVNCTVTDTALKCYWKLDETSGSTATDTSGTGNNGTLYNSPTHTACKINYGLSFNGTNQYVRRYVATGLPAANATYQTECLWFYVTTNPTDKRNALSVTGSSTGIRIGFINSGGMKFGVWRYGGTLIVSTSTLPTAGAWHHVAYVKNGNNKYLYLDGTQVNTSTNATDSGIQTAVDAARSSTGADYWPGKLDEIRIYNRALSGTEIAALAQGKQ